MPLGMETIAEADGADDEDNGFNGAGGHIEQDMQRRRKSRPVKKSAHNDFSIDPIDLDDSDEFDS